MGKQTAELAFETYAVDVLLTQSGWTKGTNAAASWI